MAEIFTFPADAGDREWKWFEAELQAQAAARFVDGGASLDECLPTLREHHRAMMSTSSLPDFTIPDELALNAEQRESVYAAVSAWLEPLRQQRIKLFAALIDAEYMAAYYRRNGPAG